MFNIRSVQNTDCIIHCKNVQKVISKSTTLQNGTWKTDWWSMFLSKLDQNHAALLLRFRRSLGGLVCHPEACMAIRLEGNRAFVAKNRVVESVSTLQNALCELQRLDFVGVSNQRAIGCPLQSPALLLSRSPSRG